MDRGVPAGHDACMPRYPSFYVLGALAGFAIRAVHAPPPFPLLAIVIMVSGCAGLALSLTYLYCFERWLLRVKLAALRRVFRRLLGRSARPRVSPRRPVDAAALVEWDAASGSASVGIAPGGWSITP
jgi:hypothetical protein